MSALPELDVDVDLDEDDDEPTDDEIQGFLRTMKLGDGSNEQPGRLPLLEQRYEPHPIAECWPMLSESEHETMRASIKAQGLLQPIVLHEGKILDGRNRYRACVELGLTPTFITYDGSDPVGYAMGVNNEHRHLDASQRALIAAKLANLSVGGDGRNQHEGRVISSSHPSP